MFDPRALWIFVGATVVMLILPGPAVLYIVARSVERGRRAGLVSTLGIATGSLFHVAAAALGLSALLLSSATAYEVLKYVGAAYLIFLGLRRLLSSEATSTLAADGDESLGRMFAQGVLVNVLNPKTALFFFAFLPQFVDPARGQVTLQILVLGALFVAISILSDGAYALVAGTAGAWIRRRPHWLRAERWISGGTLIGLGVVAACSGSNRK
jgi:threonine/homoserine/homoserine lactone efflux protein